MINSAGKGDWRTWPSVTSLVLTPAYVMMAFMLVWMIHLECEVRYNHRDKDLSGIVHNDRRVRRSTALTTNALLNLLPSMTSSNDVIYDMDLEPCGGAVFTVWGRSSCPEETNADLVYPGVVGGTNIDSYGGGVDYLCLSQHPQWSVPKSSDAFNSNNPKFNDVTKTAMEPSNEKEDELPPCSKTSSPCSKKASPSRKPTRILSRDDLMRILVGSSADLLKQRTITTQAPSRINDGEAYLYGTEYKGKNPRFDSDNLAADTFVDQDAVCAVCRSQIRASVVMIPGRRECYAGWTKEYEGFLMSGPVGARAQHRFVCMHHAPEASQGGFRRDGGAVFYHVRAMCGSLPCPTYIQDKEITCVVCTK